MRYLILATLSLLHFCVYANDTFNELMNIPANEIDLFHSALLIAKEDDSSVDIELYQQKFNAMVDELRNELEEQSFNTNQKLQAISTYLFETKGFQSHLKVDMQDLSHYRIDEVINRKEGFCMGFSILYISLGQKMGLPLKLASCPSHVFVVFQDDLQTLYIETTQRGKIYESPNYLHDYVNLELREEDMYLMNMREALGELLKNAMIHHDLAKNVDKRSELLAYSFVFHPHNAEKAKHVRRDPNTGGYIFTPAQGFSIPLNQINVETREIQEEYLTQLSFKELLSEAIQKSLNEIRRKSYPLDEITVSKIRKIIPYLHCNKEPLIKLSEILHLFNFMEAAEEARQQADRINE